MDALVIDCSVTLGFILKDEQDSFSLKTFQQLRDGVPAYVPRHWAVEVTNGLLMAERRKRSTQADTQDALHLAQGLPVTVDDEFFPHQASHTLDLARQFNLTIYDAAYLELAMRRRAALATTDHDLAHAAKTAGVKVLNG